MGMRKSAITKQMKPIIFNTPMTQAILEGRKTQTRRLILPQPTNPRWSNVGFLGFDDGHGREMKPRYKPGDVLYVRETWACGGYRSDGKDWRYYYRADGDAPLGIKWRPSIHMPKEAARIFLLVTNVYVQPLQRINDNDAKAEGANFGIGVEEKMRRSSINRFAEIWNSTIKPANRDKYGWDANPWVWVIEFERFYPQYSY